MLMDIDELLDDYTCEIILRKTWTDSDTERSTLYEDLNCFKQVYIVHFHFSRLFGQSIVRVLT